MGRSLFLAIAKQRNPGAGTLHRDALILAVEKIYSEQTLEALKEILDGYFDLPDEENSESETRFDAEQIQNQDREQILNLPGGANDWPASQTHRRRKLRGRLRDSSQDKTWGAPHRSPWSQREPDDAGSGSRATEPAERTDWRRRNLSGEVSDDPSTESTEKPIPFGHLSIIAEALKVPVSHLWEWCLDNKMELRSIHQRLDTETAQYIFNHYNDPRRYQTTKARQLFCTTLAIIAIVALSTLALISTGNAAAALPIPRILVIAAAFMMAIFFLLKKA